MTWVWEGSDRHGVSSGSCTSGGGGYYGEGESCDSDGKFSSGSHEGPFQYTHTFTQAGSFTYFCPVHGAAMKGRVIVGTPGPAPKKGGRGA